MRRDKDRKESAGLLAKLNALMDRNRLGELMVLKGLLTPHELKLVLSYQRNHKCHLGQILVEQGMVSRFSLYQTLLQQWSLRFAIMAVTLILGVSSVGVKQARAGGVKDIPPQVKLASAANVAFAPVKNYPSLFGSDERRSHNLDPFTKWTGMFTRFEQAINTPGGQKVISEWQSDLHAFQGLPLDVMAERVNSMINGQHYIVDSRNWGQSDYWETPVEFFTRGGDCEDFAIAKYVSLRALGVPEERLRVAIVHDKQKNVPHALLIVYTDKGAMVLDNQDKRMRASSDVHRYRPIFSINRQAWWLHNRPTATVIASAN